MKKSEREKLVFNLIQSAFVGCDTVPRIPGEIIKRRWMHRIDDIRQLTSDDFKDVRY